MTSFRLLVGIMFMAAVEMPSLVLAQTPAKMTAEEMKAAYEVHKADFDYLLGDWEFTTISKKYGKGRGYWSAVRLATGQILDEFRIVGDNDETYYVTTTMRAYNAARDRWELVGMDRGGGLQDVGTGRRAGAEVHIEQNFGVAAQNNSTLRIRYFNIQPDRFSWKADRSNDGGMTWIRDDQQIEARRIGPSRSLPQLTKTRETSK
jgi:hypothetical protein